MQVPAEQTRVGHLLARGGDELQGAIDTLNRSRPDLMKECEFGQMAADMNIPRRTEKAQFNYMKRTGVLQYTEVTIATVIISQIEPAADNI